MDDFDRRTAMDDVARLLAPSLADGIYSDIP
jgi:hypothetical protein